MPIYEYRCGGCGELLEVIQKFSDAPLKTCPECGGTLSKLISNTSFVLKGSGWYADGYSTADSAQCRNSSGPSDKASSPEVKAAGTSAPDKGNAPAA